MKSLCRLALVTAALGAAIASTASYADPLPQRDRLKFQQLPLDNLTYPVGDPVSGFFPQTFWGHNEFSTAYSQPDPAGGPDPVYIGSFMADDFADRATTPVLHVKWWGSYPNFNPDFPVDNFLISFESDIPVDPAIPGSFSRPDQPLLSQIVTRGPLFPGSGTFSERSFSPGGPPLHEPVFEYNAELSLDKAFFQQPNTVYWLKIVALVDAQNIILDPSQPIPPFLTQWGWHNRDYTKMDPLASTVADGVAPGEHLAFFAPSTPGVPGYHFQDDAVRGDVFIDPDGLLMPGQPPMPLVRQDPQTFRPTNYLDIIDGPGTGVFGLPGISSYSLQDLAFELYTEVPEPAGLTVMLCGLIALRRRR